MQTNIPSMLYRKDIDGLRAIAVLAVIAFHFGYFPNGYLGVDIFFVISGYLITGILFKEVQEQQFSIKAFYLRRIRRIIPLVLLVNLAVLITGLLVMLPDDLENLSESVIATNFFSNNFLQIITTKNYWDIINDYKPLLHTWSLGIEEQFYLFYPVLFWVIGNKRIKWLQPVLLLLTIISLIFFFTTSNQLFRFYLMPYRFFELSIGGIAAIIIMQKFNGRLLHTKASFLFIIAIPIILLLGNHLPNTISLCLIVIASLGVLVSENKQYKVSSALLGNELFVAIGKISFSMYMWHQPILVFVRYIFVQHYSHAQAIFIFLFILLISILSFFFIEQPFRKKAIVKTPLLLWSTSVMLVLITGIAVYVYLQAGIIRNVPELDLTHDKAERHVHAKYNDRVYDYNKDFKYDGSIKILVVGNSQARDWVNVLLESGIKEQLQISYVEKVGLCKDFIGRCSMAKFIFFSAMDTMGYTKNYQQYHIDSGKVRIIGLKNFGKSNGFFYNKKHDASYCKQRVKINEKILQTNEFLSNEWGNHYINLIGIMIDSNNSVPVFTPDCKFISQDCLHLTKNGSLYFGHLLHQYIKANFMFQ